MVPAARVGVAANSAVITLPASDLCVGNPGRTDTALVLNKCSTATSQNWIVR
jgi:hypothetical protein